MTITSIFVTAIFIIVITILPFVSSHFRKNKNLIKIYWLIMVLYQIIAFTNAFLFRTTGADMDAHSFHVLATEISNSGVFLFDSDANLYKNILGLLYWLTGPLHILGEQLSILSISISIIVFVKIIDLLKLNRYQTPLVFIYAALPTMFMLGSITLREPIQVFLLITAVYFGLKMKIYSNNKIINFFFMLLFSVMMGLLHKALFLYSVVLIGVFLFWDINKINKKIRITKYRLIGFITTPIILYLFFQMSINSNASGAELFGMISSFDILDAIVKHRSVTPIGRASYGIPLDTSSFITVIYSSFLIYFNYLFTPFIWQISSLSDIYAYLESILHMILIYYSIKLWKLEKGQMHQILGMLLILFFIMTLMWAFGTTNYGTGMRHKMLSWWMLALMGGPLFYQSISHQIRLFKYRLYSNG